MEEVYARIFERSAQIDTLNFELRMVGQGAIKNALDKLTELASQDVRIGQFVESTDLEAAKALAKLGIDALKLARAGAAPRDEVGGDKDLFDAAPDPWKLKKIE